MLPVFDVGNGQGLPAQKICEICGKREQREEPVLGERAAAVRSNLLEVFHAWLGISYNFKIELSQSQQDPVVFDRNLKAMQGSQVQNLLEGCWVFLGGGESLWFGFFLGGGN